MKRLVLLFLMLMLPLQFSWAGVSVYCQHETGTAAQHVGHHDHQHQKSPDTDDGGAPGKAHADCGYCHLAHSCVVVAALPVPAFACTAAAIAAQHDTLPSFFPEGPERPKWMRFA